MTAAVLARPRPRQAELSVVLADDHPVVRGGLRALLSDVAGITVVAETATRDMASVLAHEPDVLIVDLPMHGHAGVATIQSVLRAAPGLAVLVFTTSEDDESVFNAMRAGARGYILKGAEQSDIVRAIRGVAAGEAIFGARIAARLTELMMRQTQPDRHPFPELTSREREILELIAEGLPNPAIAHRLYLAPKTVRNNISAILAKLCVADRAEAIVLARTAGLGLSKN